MRAVVFDRYGGPEELYLAELPSPVPRAGEALIRVEAVGVNPVDWKLRQGRLRLVRPLRAPRLVGLDLAGTIEAVGPGVTELGPGTPVVAAASPYRIGAYAEFVARQAKTLVVRPEGLSAVEAAAMPTAGVTALQALRAARLPTTDAAVLIVGASGGVGTFAVQLARAQGARVTAMCSERNGALVRELGADDVVAYDTGARPPEGRFDAVLDAVDVMPFREAKRYLCRGGRLVNVSSGPGSVVRLFEAAASLVAGEHKRMRPLILLDADVEDLRQLVSLWREGRLRSVVEQVFPLEQAAEAHRRSETHRVVGKLVLRVGS